MNLWLEVSCTFQSKLYVVPFTLLQGDPWSVTFAASTSHSGQALHNGHLNAILHQLSINHLTNECKNILLQFGVVQVFWDFKRLTLQTLLWAVVHFWLADSECLYMNYRCVHKNLELCFHPPIFNAYLPHWQCNTRSTNVEPKSVTLSSCFIRVTKEELLNSGLFKQQRLTHKALLLIKQHSWVLV